MATLNKRSARPATGTTPVVDGDDETRPSRHRHRRARVPAPRSPLAYGAGIATVCTLAFVNLLSGEPATATVEPTASVAVAEALGIEGTEVEAPVAEDSELLGQLAASRAERDANQAAAASAQAQAEEEAAADKAEAERRAAEEAAAAAAAEEEAAETEAAEAEAAAAPAGTAVSAVAQINNTAGSIRAEAQNAANAVVSNVPGAAGISLGGTRASAADPGGHPSGLAVDYMVLSDAALGDAIVQYHIDNWDALGVDYLIWQQRYLSSPGAAWSYMEDRGDATANHYDHVHVNYRG